MRLIDADELYLPSEEMISKMIISSAPTVNTIPIPEGATNGDMGEVSDGYHTFNQLYH